MMIFSCIFRIDDRIHIASSCCCIRDLSEAVAYAAAFSLIICSICICIHDLGCQLSHPSYRSLHCGHAYTISAPTDFAVHCYVSTSKCFADDRHLLLPQLPLQMHKSARAAAFARCVSSYAACLANPDTLVRVSTGIPNASQKFTKSAAFSAPSAVKRSVKFCYNFCYLHHILLIRLATAPTVSPFRSDESCYHIFRKITFWSQRKYGHQTISAQMRLQYLLLHSQESAHSTVQIIRRIPHRKHSSSLLDGKHAYESTDICKNLFFAVSATSTSPASSLWNFAEDVSHLEIVISCNCVRRVYEKLSFLCFHKCKIRQSRNYVQVRLRMFQR